MRKIVLISMGAFIFVACSTKKQIDYVSPCACYEIEKITEFKG